ncbi:MAG: hypothetical protein H7Y08_07530 [Rhizobiaceae bacterium]|nr:hypothetical protein [Rhizobiaceae bacterium]
MDDAPDGLPGSHAADAATGGFLGLSALDAALVEELCGETLKASGIDGTLFFARLREGRDMDAALGFPPQLREFVYASAHRWFGVGRADKAEGLFRSLCVADPADADYWVGLGVCMRVREELDGAALAFGTARRLRPQWEVPAFHACELAIRRGALDEAETRLAAFRALATPETAPELAREADRLAKALAGRRATDVSEARR